VTASAQARTLPLFAGDASGAQFSSDRRHRYHLWRAWGDTEHRCVFVGLNPSRADEADDDLTITKCIGFARRWGFGAIDMVNLFAFVSTDPRALVGLDIATAVGGGNDLALSRAFSCGARVVWCWGATALPHAKWQAMGARSIASQVTKTGHLLERGTLGLTRGGAPRHPCRIAYATPFQVES
jgi:hypothetical protein